MRWRLRFFGTLHKTNEAVVVGEHGERSLKHLTQAKSYFISNLNVFCF